MKEILFTRQIHDADRAGRHYDIRLVDGSVAKSWATKKELPEPGKSILLFQQPDHTANYALSEEIEIPKGQYGAGKTKLDFIRKATIEHSENHFTMTTSKGEKFLFKHVPKFGEDAWLFKNLTSIEKTAMKISDLIPTKNNAVLEHIAANPDAYFFHGTPYTDEVKKEGLSRERAFKRASEKELYDRQGIGHEGYRFSLSSIQEYSKAYTKEGVKGTELPLLVKVQTKHLDPSSIFGTKWLGADEYRYAGDIPVEDVIFPGTKEYEQMISNNKYLEKIASFEKTALTRLVKEMIKRKGAGLPVSEAEFHELARRGASRSMLQYAKGVSKRDNKFMKHLGVTSIKNGPISTLMNEYAIKPTEKELVSIMPGIAGHSHRASSNYDMINRTIDSAKTKTKGLIRSHEVHEATEASKIGAQKISDDIWSRTPREIKHRLFNNINPANPDPLQGEFAKRYKEKIIKGIKHPSPSLTDGQGHLSWAVLGRESNDFRTNPFAKTLSSGMSEARTQFGEAGKVNDITGKRFGVDKMTNKDLMKLRKAE